MTEEIYIQFRVPNHLTDGQRGNHSMAIALSDVRAWEDDYPHTRLHFKSGGTQRISEEFSEVTKKIDHALKINQDLQ